MKRIFTILAVVLLATTSLIAQETPVGVNIVVKDETGKLLINKKIGVKLSILKDMIMYSETHEVTTDENGILSLGFGKGESLEGNYEEINWIEHEKSLKTEIDPTGGNNYTTSIEEEIMAVPNAMAAVSAEALSNGEDKFTFNDIVLKFKEIWDEITKIWVEITSLRKDVDELKNLTSNSNNIIDEFVFTDTNGVVTPGLSWRTKVEGGSVKDSLEISFLSATIRENWARDTNQVDSLMERIFPQTNRVKLYSVVKNYKIESETSTEIIYSTVFTLIIKENFFTQYYYKESLTKITTMNHWEDIYFTYYVKHTRTIKK